MTPRSLRTRVNLVALPPLVLALGLFALVDYAHERRTVTATHALHDMNPAAAAASSMPPATVAGRSLRIHLVAGTLVVVMLASTLNAALTRFVIRPLAEVERGIAQMERGHWRVTLDAARVDEVQSVVERFRALGPTLGALMLHALQAERLATIALLSKRMAARIEPELDRLGTYVGRLEHGDATTDVTHGIAAAAARIRCSVRELDTIFAAACQAERRR